MLHNLRPANEYHEFASSVLSPWDLYYLARLKQVSLSMKPGILVDVGTATGVIPFKLAHQKAFDEWKLVGLDLDASMIERGRPEIAHLPNPQQVELEVGDAEDLPLADSSVDIVASRATLHHLSRKAHSLYEAYRTIKPGGAVLIHDMRRDAPAETIQKFQDMRAKIGYPESVVEEKLTLSEVHDVIQEAGLQSCSSVTTAETGLASLGYEILIRKPA